MEKNWHTEQNDEKEPPIGDVSPPIGGSFSGEDKHAYRALRSPDFLLLLCGVFLSMFGRQMIAVAIGWELYNRTNSALALGGIGLAQVIPLILLFLPSGYVADRYSRKYVVMLAQLLTTIAALCLAALSYFHGSLLLIYVCLIALGTTQSFSNPASSALVSQVVSEEAYENATTWRSSVAQLSAVLGPAAGGLLIGFFHGTILVYVLSAAASLIFVLLLFPMHLRPQIVVSRTQRSWGALIEGLRFLGKTQVMLAAITLDLFAVLLGGATTLLPIYAKDILHVGAVGLGWLNAADSIGAVCMALLLASRPPFKHAGRILLLAVAGFGVATIVFGISRQFWLSLVMLFMLGACDNISVVIRTTLALVRTPDEMRGRVGAVTSLFIGTSNQLGGFESGLAAQLLGTVPSVVVGGIGTLVVVALIAVFWPEMRRLTTLREIKPE
ncbi:MAG TPA: MFS transporter [Ktedonobacteraceae bacterium]|jgi:MFS family permease|nr:MFS transporter [Ktedonobacteraceae bacterium]